MEISFIYESNHFAARGNPDLCRRFEAVFEARALSPEEVEVTYLAVWDTETDQEIPLSDFPETEQREMERRAEREALGHVGEMWSDRFDEDPRGDR